MDDTERLVVLLEARVRDFERNMQKASGTAGREFGQMRRDANTASKQMESDMVRSTGRINQALASVSTRAGSLAAAFGPIAAGVTVAAGALVGFVAQARSTAREIATIGDEARRAGIGVKAFQELKFVAEQNRVGIDALTDGIKEMNLRADEFIITGKGSGAEAFARLGFTAADLAKKLKDPSALFTEIIGKLEHLDRAAQIRIADEIFGGSGGEQFVQLIDEGAAGIRRTIDEANRLGIVMDEAMIARAAEIDRQFHAITQTVGTSLKGAIVNAAASLADFIDGFRDFENQRNSSLNDEITSLGAQRLDIENQILTLRKEQSALSDTAKALGFGSMDDRQIADLEAQNAALGEQEAKLLAILKARGAFETSSRESTEQLRSMSTAGAAVGDSLDYISRNGGSAIDAGVTKPTREATAALREAEAAKRRLMSEADSAVAAFFPFETAVAEAQRLMAIVDDTTNGLDDLQRAALRLQADQAFADLSTEANRAAGEVDNLRATSVSASEDIGRAFMDNVGSTFLDIFTDASSGADSFFDRLVKGFSSIGKQFAEIGKDRLLANILGPAAGYTSGALAPGGRSVFPQTSLEFSAPTPTSAIRQTSTRLAETVTKSVSENLLHSVLGAGKSASHISGLNTEFANSLTAMFAAAPASVQAVTKINSGFRSVARQAELFEAAVSKYGSEAAARKMVAPPGRSYHNHGQAADLGFGSQQAENWFHENASRFNLKFPMGYEPWHIEASSTRGGGSVGSANQGRVLRQAVSDGNIDATRRLASGAVPGASLGGYSSGPQMSPAAQQAMQNGWSGFGPVPGERMQAGFSVLGAAGGAFAGGYQSGNMLSGLAGGAMSGFGAAGSIASLFPALAGVAGPVGAVAGAALGALGSPLAGRSCRASEHSKRAKEFDRDSDQCLRAA